MGEQEGSRVLFTALKMKKRILDEMHTVNKVPVFPGEPLTPVMACSQKVIFPLIFSLGFQTSTAHTRRGRFYFYF